MWQGQSVAASVRRGSIRSRVDGTTLMEALVAMGLASVVLASGLALQLRLGQETQALMERTQAIWFLQGLETRLQVAFPRQQGTYHLNPAVTDCTAPPEDVTLSLPAVLDAWFRGVQCTLPGVTVTAELSPVSRELRLIWPDRSGRPPVVLQAGDDNAS